MPDGRASIAGAQIHPEPERRGAGTQFEGLTPTCRTRLSGDFCMARRVFIELFSAPPCVESNPADGTRRTAIQDIAEPLSVAVR